MFSTGKQDRLRPTLIENRQYDTHFCLLKIVSSFNYVWLPWWLRWQRICLRCGIPRFSPWMEKIPWKMKWLPTPIFLPGKSHRQRSLLSTVHGVAKRVGSMIHISVFLKIVSNFTYILLQLPPVMELWVANMVYNVDTFTGQSRGWYTNKHMWVTRISTTFKHLKLDELSCGVNVIYFRRYRKTKR